MLDERTILHQSAGRSVNSLSQHWCTPQKYVDAVRDFLGEIELDPCSNEHSIVRAGTEYRLPEIDGLRADWKYRTIYVNPPYGADRSRRTTIKDWLRRCADAHEKYSAEVLALIPVASNTTHWKHFIFGKAASICFLYDTRLKFIINGTDDNKGAPMACCIVYWGKNITRFQKKFSRFGATVDISNLIGKQFGVVKEIELSLF